MRHRTSEWVKLAARGRFQMEVKARINGKDYTAISAPQINRALMSSPCSVGNCNTATLTLSILTDDTLVSSDPITILGRIYHGNQYSEWLEFGTFFIDQRETNYDGLITLNCYDAMLKTNQNYLADDDDDSISWPKTMKTVVEEIAYRIGVGIDPRTKINTGNDYAVTYPSGKTMEEVLGYIGACHGGNWIITEENLLRLVPLVTAPDETFHVITADYENIQTPDGYLLSYRDQTVFNATLPAATGETPQSVIKRTYHITDESGRPIVTPDGYYLVWAEDGSVDAVDGLINVPVVCGELTTGPVITVTGVSASAESGGNSFTAGDDSGYVLTIDSNPYMTQNICNDLYTAFNGLVYAPFDATSACYDPATELGDQVKIGDKVFSAMYSMDMTLDIDFRSDIGAPNSEDLSEEYPYLTQYERLQSAKAELELTISEVEQTLTTSLEKTESSIMASVKAAEEADRYNYITNGDFTTNADEWSVSNSSYVSRVSADEYALGPAMKITAGSNNTTYRVYQTIASLPSGTYRVRFKAATVPGSEETARVRMVFNGSSYITTAGALKSDAWTTFDYDITLNSAASDVVISFYSYVAGVTVYVTGVIVLGYYSRYVESALTVSLDGISAEVSEKVGNDEVRTKFAADSTSVTVSSGVISFTSNSITIDSDNFKLTKNGQVTATGNFTAGTDTSYKMTLASGSLTGYSLGTQVGRITMDAVHNWTMGGTTTSYKGITITTDDLQIKSKLVDFKADYLQVYYETRDGTDYYYTGGSGSATFMINPTFAYTTNVVRNLSIQKDSEGHLLSATWNTLPTVYYLTSYSTMTLSFHKGLLTTGLG